MPTLVLAGAADRHTPADVMERMAGRIEGSRFECISGAGHLAHMERPASYDDCLVRFVAEL